MDPEIAALIEETREPGPGPEPDAARERMVLSMINEAARTLDDDVVSDPADIDIAMIMGTGIPAVPGRAPALRRSPGAAHGGREAAGVRLTPGRAVPAGPRPDGTGPLLRLSRPMGGSVRDVDGAPEIEIHYRRPPDRLRTFRQRLAIDHPDYKVTLLESYPGATPVRVHGTPVLEPGAPVVWTVFPDRWYDVGRFHLANGAFTGFYGNLILPPDLEGGTWEITDLFLDVWLDRDGGVSVLDRDEFDEAVDRGWIDRRTARRARDELDRVVAEAASGRWPPGPAREYDLERVRELLGG